MSRLLIVGATSAIAEAAARLFARRGDSLMLAGRDLRRLQAMADDLRVRGAAQAHVGAYEATDPAAAAAVLQLAQEHLGGLDAILIAHGTLPEQSQCADDLALTLQQFQVNATSVIALCTLAATLFQCQRSGVIAVLSSVAGERGRASNYVYGAAKAAVTTFTSGLRQRLRPHNVRVVTIKPGFVDTPMTARFKKGLLWASPPSVARDIVQAMDRGTGVIYTPWFWRPIMFVVRSIPESVFVRLRM